jgi:hypothetical protein
MRIPRVRRRIGCRVVREVTEAPGCRPEVENADVAGAPSPLYPPPPTLPLLALDAFFYDLLRLTLYDL